MENKRKKNWAMRMASLTLLFTLISACLMSGTLAKYTTQGQGSDTARVAKWGVEVTANSSGLFSPTYEFDTTPTSTTLGAYSVSSANGTDKVLAPGTEGEAFGFSISGTPEVATKVTLSNFDYELTNWGLNEADIPVKWTLTRTVGGSLTTLVTDGTLADVKTALDNAANASIEYAPNTDLSQGSATDGFTLSWAWDFGTTTADDDRDTALGDAAIASDIGIALSYDITVEQID